MMRVALGMVPKGLATVRLQFRRVRHASESFEVRIFINATGADASTSTVGNAAFGGSVWIYGHGMPVYDSAAEQSDAGGGGIVLAPYDTAVDITAAVRSCLPDGGPLEVTLVVVDDGGGPLPFDRFRFENITMRTQT